MTESTLNIQDVENKTIVRLLSLTNLSSAKIYGQVYGLYQKQFD